MKLFNKIALFALAGLAFTACSDDYDWTQPTEDTELTTEGDSVQNVSFVNATYNVEKDPTEETVSTFQVKRQYTTTTDTIPFEVITNTDSVFNIGLCIFQAGDSIATVEVSYPNAVPGEPYTLQLAITDPRYASGYGATPTLTMNVNRVKWVALEGKARMTDKCISSIFLAFEGQDAYNDNIVIEMRDDDHSRFRIRRPLHGMNATYQGQTGTYVDWGFIEESDENASEYLSFRVLKNGEEIAGMTVAHEDMVYFSPFNTGISVQYEGNYLSYYHPANISIFESQDDWLKNKVLSWQDNGLPGKVQLAPLPLAESGYYMDYTQNDGMVLIYFPGYKDPVTVKMAEDFEWEEVYTGDFVSEMMDDRSEATLYKGVKCTQTTDGADTVFANTYGTAYAIESPYAEGYNLYFAVDAEGNIQIPEDVTLQNTGMKAMKDEIYAKINGNMSTYTPNQILLNITFTNKDKTVEYGTANEIIQHITYSPVGTVDYTYFNYFYQYDEAADEYYPITQKDILLEKRDDRDDWYVMRNWAGNQGDCHILIDPETNQVSVPVQGFIDKIMVENPIQIVYGDMVTIGEVIGKDWPASSYDPQTGHASIFMYYQDDQYAYYDEEYPEEATFHFTPVSAAKAKAMKRAQNTLNLKKGNAKKGMGHKAKKTPAYMRKHYPGAWSHAKKVKKNIKAFQPMALKNR